MPFGGHIIAENAAVNADFVHGYVTFDHPMPNTNYKAIATLVTEKDIIKFDKNYDVNVSISNKTTSGFTINIHRGTEGFLDTGGSGD